MDAYSAIAKIYDKANTDFDYSTYFEFTKRFIGGNVVELACGSGAFTGYLLKAADKVIAVDSCEQMMNIAVKNHFKHRQYVQFVRDDLKNFLPPAKVDCVVCVCDGFNYVSPSEIEAVFKKISGYLKTNGYFIFDISSEYKLSNVLGNNIFFEDNDDFTYLWTNKLFSDRVEMEIAMFEPCGNLYKREDESHTQYIHTKEKIQTDLKNCGFEVATFDGENFGQCSDLSLRLLFVCKKN